MDAGGPAANTRDMCCGISTRRPAESVMIRGASCANATVLARSGSENRGMHKLRRVQSRMDVVQLAVVRRFAAIAGGTQPENVYLYRAIVDRKSTRLNSS